LLFAGELYLGRDPFPLLEALEWLLARPGVDAARVELVFMGKASSYGGQSIRAWTVGKRCACVVKTVPPQNSDAVLVATNRATVLVNLAQHQPLSVPGKTYEQLASGREVLLLCEDDCETAQVVAGLRGVTQVDPSNSDALTSVLLELYERHVARGTLTPPAEAEVSRFSRDAANASFYQVLLPLLTDISPDAAR
jgi:hypothetical protein